MTGGSHGSLAKDFKNTWEQKLLDARNTITHKEHRTHTGPGIYIMAPAVTVENL